MMRLIAQSLGILILASAVCSCEQSADDARPLATAPQVESKAPFAWQQLRESTVVAVDDPAVEQELAAAAAESHRTLEDARTRWGIAKPQERALWAVKWAAPLAAADGQTVSAEHIWVQPINWSQFRIEGLLLSTPAAALECGRSTGEVVSFPIDELSDWIHFAADPAINPDTAFEGGYTVKVLEQRYGTPATK